jgi:hypothetical protein
LPRDKAVTRNNRFAPTLQRMSRYFLIAMAGGFAALIALLLGLGPFSKQQPSGEELSPAKYISIPD